MEPEEHLTILKELIEPAIEALIYHAQQRGAQQQATYDYEVVWYKSTGNGSAEEQHDIRQEPGLDHLADILQIQVASDPAIKAFHEATLQFVNECGIDIGGWKREPDFVARLILREYFTL